MFTFSKSSLNRLKTAECDLQKLAILALKYSLYDFGISEGHRTIKRQAKLYAQGRTTPGDIVTNVDGVNKKGKHNYDPSRAIDVFAYVNGGVSWHVGYYVAISKAFERAGKELGIKYSWGGDWKFKDYPHYEI